MKQLIYLLLLVSYIGYGQSVYKLSGLVMDIHTVAIAHGEVSLLDKELNRIKNISLTEGRFTFDAIAPAEYILYITATGYKSQYKNIKIDKDKTITFYLKKSEIQLDEVTLKTFKNNISFDKGNLKLRLTNSILETFPTTLDILSKLPEVQISPDQESIHIIGKGQPLIYIDNQKSNLDQLKSISVEEIKDIELINHPSVKYEAEGRSVIRITRKHTHTDGYNITFSETASFKRKFNNYLALHSNYKKKQLELRAHFNYNQLGFWEGADSNLTSTPNQIRSQYQVTAIGSRPQFITGIGAHYQIHKDDYISGQVNIRSHNDNIPIQTQSIFSENQKEDHILTQVTNNEKRHLISSNINFSKKLYSASTLFFGLQYSTYLRHPKSSIYNATNGVNFEFSQNRDQRYEVNVFAGRIDIEHKIKSTTTFEIGGSFAHANAFASSDFEFRDLENNIATQYDYREAIYGSYINLSGNIHSVEYTTGLRSETNLVSGRFRNEKQLLVDRKQTQLFPKVQLHFPIDSLKSITLNYSKTINRPGYLNASSISTFINPHAEFSRNVNLKPTVTQEISGTFQYKKYSGSIQFYTNHNPVFYDILYDTANRRFISSPQNFEKESGIQIRLGNTATHKFWTTTNAVSIMYNHIKKNNAIIQASKPYLYYYSNNEFRLAPKTTFAINLWGLTKQYQGIFKRNAMFIMNMSLSKTVFKNLKLSVHTNDVFRNLNYKNKYTSNGVTTQDIFYVDAKEISFALKYSFGKAKTSTFKNKDIDTNLDRM